MRKCSELKQTFVSSPYSGVNAGSGLQWGPQGALENSRLPSSTAEVTLRTKSLSVYALGEQRERRIWTKQNTFQKSIRNEGDTCSTTYLHV